MEEKCDICEKKRSGCVVVGVPLWKYRMAKKEQRGIWQPEVRVCHACRTDHKGVEEYRQYKRRVYKA